MSEPDVMIMMIMVISFQGQCGLLFTDREESDVISFIEEFVERDYARSGTKASEEVILKEGPLTQFSHAIEPHLRSLGMPTQLKKGIVTLLQDFTVCKKRQVLTPQQANILVNSGILNMHT